MDIIKTTYKNKIIKKDDLLPEVEAQLKGKLKRKKATHGFQPTAVVDISEFTADTIYKAAMAHLMQRVSEMGNTPMETVIDFEHVMNKCVIRMRIRDEAGACPDTRDITFDFGFKSTESKNDKFHLDKSLTSTFGYDVMGGISALFADLTTGCNTLAKMVERESNFGEHFEETYNLTEKYINKFRSEFSKLRMRMNKDALYDSISFTHNDTECGITYNPDKDNIILEIGELDVAGNSGEFYDVLMHLCYVIILKEATNNG